MATSGSNNVSVNKNNNASSANIPANSANPSNASTVNNTAENANPNNGSLNQEHNYLNNVQQHQ